MVKVTIFQNNEMIAIQDFKMSFFVLEDGDEIFWSIDDKMERAGSIRLWVQQASLAPNLSGVLPEWSVSIDNVPLEQKFYEEIVDLAGKTVSAAYKGRRFVFEF